MSASGRATAAAVAQARDLGLRFDSAQSVADSSNVLVRLAPLPVVARVATTTATVRADGAFQWFARDVAVAGALGPLAVAPTALTDPGPHRCDGFVVSFWDLVEEVEPGVRAEEFGDRLAALHGALARVPDHGYSIGGTVDDAATMIRTAAAAGALPAGQADHLIDGLDQVRPALCDPTLPVQVLHGDAHPGNLLRTPDGLKWTDFEDTCLGPIQWDLACMAASQRLTGADDPLAEALTAYGAPADIDLKPFLKARHLQGAAWTAVVEMRRLRG